MIQKKTLKRKRAQEIDEPKEKVLPSSRMSDEPILKKVRILFGKYKLKVH